METVLERGPEGFPTLLTAGRKAYRRIIGDYARSPAAHAHVRDSLAERDLALAEIASTARAAARRIQSFGPDWRRSLFQLVTTLACFAAVIAAMVLTLNVSYLLTLLLAIPGGGLLVRLFIIQHDCGHGSFFKSRAGNDALGRALSVLTLTPYGDWKQGHATHHATSGNLDRRGRGDIDMLTLAEYRALSPLQRFGYRLYRSPLILVLLGAPLNFIILQRIPRGRSREVGGRRSIMGLNLALLVLFGGAAVVVGAAPLFAIYLPIAIVASWIGNWLFYIQHQFDETYWARGDEWDYFAAALGGSSYFQLTPILQWFSGNIGLHHVHHLCSRIPNYHLQACLEAAPELNRFARRITLRDSLDCWKLTLWDEDRRRMVTFCEA